MIRIYNVNTNNLGGREQQGALPSVAPSQGDNASLFYASADLRLAVSRHRLGAHRSGRAPTMKPGLSPIRKGFTDHVG